MIATLTWIDLLIVAAIPVGLIAGFAVLRADRAPGIPAKTPSSPPDIQPVHSFEFDLDGTLVASNSSALKFLSEIAAEVSNWSSLRSELLARFKGLPVSISPSDGPRITAFSPRSALDPMELCLERHEHGLTALLRPRGNTAGIDGGEIHKELASLENIELIQAATERAPFPIWQTYPGGVIGWTNACYRDLEASVERTGLAANTPLFDLPQEAKAGDTPRRISIKDTGRNRTYWYDVTPLAFGRSTLNFAIDVHATVNAEAAQRNFVQTLAKTFAHLATGLAIFDHNRQLVLFNPALIDLTGLAPDFLTARPNLFSFFDQLRDRQIMPEPKNYSNWRERVAEVVTAASDDNFSETWHLPTGLTYRVTGRPHPDGAIAFLVEDISAEISLTRKFRAEADVTHSALDALDEAVAIFNESGFLLHCNTSMRTQLSIPSDAALTDHSVRELSRLWQADCKPTPVWGEIRDFVSGAQERASWTARVMRKQGEQITVHVAPLKAGATMVRFLPLAAAHSSAGPIGKNKSKSDVAA